MKTNLKGQLAVAKTNFSSSCTRFCVVLLSCLLITNIVLAQAQTITASTAGTYYWLCPNGVTSVNIKCYGAGGGGGRAAANNTACGGGGGGAYASSTLTVTPGTIYTIVVGSGGAGSNPASAGGDTYFSSITTVMAKGGSATANSISTGASGGSASSSVGTVRYNGGNGGTGSGTTAGAGGGCAGPTGAGGNGGTGTTVGTGNSPGGNGGAGRTGSNGTGSNGTTYGGGGGGALRVSTSSSNGGSGASGAVIIDYNGVSSSIWPLGVIPTYTGDEDITNVTIGTMNNSSNCSTPATGTGSLLNQYANYMSSVTGPSVNQGETVSFSLTMTTCGGTYTNFFQIYIDFNNDGDFADNGEQVYSQATGVSGNQTATGSFVIPITQSAGTYRMRVLNSENSASTTNYTTTAFSYGEVEDYLITINSIPSCSGTPASASINSSASTICAGASASLSLSTSYSLSGITYQWQSSTTSGGPYSNLGTAATQSTGALSATTYYVCTITCTNSSSSYTTPEAVVTVNQLPSVAVNSGTYCSGGTALTLTATGATSYAWSPSTGLSASSGTSVNANPTATTTYTVTGTAANGCVATATSTVTYVLTPSTISLTQSPASVCNGNVATLTSTGGAISNIASNYNVQISSGVALNSMASPTGTLLSSNLDDVASSLTNIGFTFNFAGVNYTQFWVNSNGLVGFSTTPFSSATNSTTAATNYPILMPFNDDLGTYSGGVTYKLIGSSPNRQLIIDWQSGICCGGTTAPGIVYQVVLSETSNTIQFIYNIGVSSGRTGSVGMASSSSSFLSFTTSNNSNSTVTANDNNSGLPTSGTSYLFSPPSVAQIWSPTTNLYTNSAATTAYANTSTATVYALNSTATTYTLTATNGSCATSNTVTTSIAPLPTITLGSASDVCSGTTSSSLTYSATTGSPDQYIIDYDATANVQGFTDITTYTTLTASPISLAVPANAAAGIYNGTLTVKNSSTGCVSSTYAFTVTVNGIVTISTQPASQVVLPNATATFSVSASGTGLSYQWEELVPSGTWTAIANTGIYSGATSNTLVLTGVTSGNSGNQYRVVITGTAPCAALTSNAATLTISTTAITAQPQNQTICSSTGTATFGITTSGSTPTYQWEESTNGGNTWTPLAGETNATLTLSGLTISNNGSLYHCVLNGTITSNSATLIVNAPSIAGTVSANQAICSSASAADLTLSGNTGTIQWQVSTNNINFTNISNATGSTLTSTQIGSLSSTRYYRVEVTNGVCSPSNSSVATITVTTAPNAGTLSGTQTICVGAITSFSSNGDVGGLWTSSNTSIATINSLGTVTGVAAGTTTMTYTITGTGGCSNSSETRTVTVNPLPSAISLTPSTTQNICAGNIQSIVASGASGASESTSTVFQEDFNSATNNWSLINSSTSGTPANANWTLRSNYTYSSMVFNSNDNSQFYMTNSDAQGSGSTTLTMLTSPSFSTLSANSGTISFYHYFRASDAGRVQYSLDGINFTTITTYTSTLGTASAFVNATISLPPAALNQPSVYLRFRYEATWDYYWAIDNVIISINKPNITWSPTTDLYTNAAATSAYTGNPTTVYSKPTANRTYTATATTSNGCTASASVTLNYVPSNTASAASSTPTLCANTALTAITHTTTGATGISSAGVSGANTLPAGVSATWANNTITISGTPTSAGTFNYSIPLTGGCGSVNATGTITVNALPTTSVLTGTLACAGSTGTISSSTSQSGVNYQLYDASNTAVGSAIAGTGSSLTWSSLPIASGYYVIGTDATSSCVSPNSSAVAVGTITNKTWTGATSNDWSTASNWSCGIAPTSSDAIIINTNTNPPVMGVDFTVGATGSLTISGTGSLVISPSKTLTIAGAVNFGANSVTLKSDASGTARIAQITGTLTGATNVTQERYVPGKAVRKWSFLASPVTQSLASAWQQQIHITGPGTGGTMCNNYTTSGTMTPHSNGFDVTQLQNPSFYTYNATSNNFVANTSGTNNFTLTPGEGYMVLVRGDRNDATNGGCVLLSANNQAAFTSIPVTLAATGAVGQGTISKVLPAGYSFIGNPYPCELDFSSFNTTNASVISGGYWTYYPTNATYTFSTYNNGTSTNGGTQVIANGQSFLVNSTSGGTITFNEAHKSTSANNGGFRLHTTWDELIRVGLSNNQGNRFDEVVIRFGNDAAITKSINEYDAASVNAGDQWIKTMKDATELAIQTRPNTYQNDTVALAIHAKNAGTYQLGFSEYQGLSNTEVYLIDQQENLIQNVKALPSYDFSVAANTTTANRFKLIFNAKTSGVGSIASNTQLQVYPNPTKDKVSITCNSLEYGAYQVKVRTITGAEVLQAKGFYKNGDVIELSLNDLAVGMYLLELSQDNGFRATQKITKH